MEEGVYWRRSLEETCEGSYGGKNTDLWRENELKVTILQKHYFDYDGSVAG